MILWPHQDLAFDLSLAALLGDNIYNFGELLAHPIVSTTNISFLYWGYIFFVLCRIVFSNYLILCVYNTDKQFNRVKGWVGVPHTPGI